MTGFDPTRACRTIWRKGVWERSQGVALDPLGQRPQIRVPTAAPTRASLLAADSLS